MLFNQTPCSPNYCRVAERLHNTCRRISHSCGPNCKGSVKGSTFTVLNRFFCQVLSQLKTKLNQSKLQECHVYVGRHEFVFVWMVFSSHPLTIQLLFGGCVECESEPVALKKNQEDSLAARLPNSRGCTAISNQVQVLYVLLYGQIFT